jgi:AbrB family looped-hinge helix DNA binding protein
MIAYTTMTEKGQITLPAQIRRALQLTPGKKLQIVFDGDSISICKPVEIKETRRILQAEMAQNGTAAINTQSGDGWAAHVTETYTQEEAVHGF